MLANGMGSMVMCYDMTNAFFCSDRNDLEASVGKVFPKAADDVFHATGKALFQQRIRDTSLTIDAGGCSRCVRPTTGMPPGDSKAAEMFQVSFRDPVLEWVEDTSDMQIWMGDWQGELEVDVGLTQFADDLARRMLCNTEASAVRMVRSSDGVLDEKLAKYSYGQNKGKRTCFFRFCGRGSDGETRKLVRRRAVLDARVARSCRYLGSQCNFSGSLQDERGIRLRAAKAAFYSISRFWRSAPLKLARVLFLALVVGTLFSGLEAFVVAKSDSDLFDSLLAMVMARLMAMVSAMAAIMAMVVVMAMWSWRWSLLWFRL